MTTRRTVEIVVSHPNYDAAMRTLKQLARARKHKQFADRTDAVDLVSDTIKKLTDPKRVYEPCELTDVINKAAKRNKKFRDALNLIEFER
jgi:hypothetical protein